MGHRICSGLGILVLCLCTTNLLAQVDSTRVAPIDSLQLTPDSLQVDSLQVDSLQVAGLDSTRFQQGDSLRARTGTSRPTDKKPVTFNARDSLIISFQDEQKIGTMYGEAKVSDGSAGLNAYQIDLDFEASQVRARGLVVDTGMVGRPQFKKDEEQFYGNELAYNLDTGKGRVVQVRSEIENGYVFGEVSKTLGDSVIYIKNAMFTTCDHEGDPHYHIRASRMKIVNGEWIYTGPLHVRVFNVPLPLWLPFGFLPAKEGRRSGPLPPTYGEDDRGFYLRDFGWYWAMNEYMDFQTRVGLWTSGSWQIAPQFRYNRRYAYSGQVALDWVRNRQGQTRDPDFTIINTWSIRAQHNQTVNPTTSFNANIDFSTTNYLRTVSRAYNDQVRQSIGSNVQFNKRWKGRSLSVSAQQRQQLQAGGMVNLTLPTLRFSQTTRNPFQRKNRLAGQKERWYEKITFGYTGNLNNTFTFDPDTSLAGADGIEWYEALFSGDQYEQATGEAASERFNFKATHSIPVAAPFSFQTIPGTRIPFRLNVSPNFSYTEDWYLRTQRRGINDSTGTVETSSEAGFQSIRQISTGISANTTLYGLFPIKIGPFDGFRHEMRPTASFTYRPDYSSDFWGYFRSYTDTTGQEIEYPVVSGLSSGKQQNLGLGLNNVFQTRRVKTDSTGEVQSQIIRFLTLNFSSSYNIAADSLRWRPISMTARTSILNNKFSFNLNAGLDPYAINENGRRINEYFWGRGGWPVRLTNLNFTARTSFRSSRTGGQGRPFAPAGDQFFSRGQGSPLYDDPFAADYFNTPVGYADFAIPWNVSLDFTYALSRGSFSSNKRAIVNTSFDFNLTPKLKVQGRSGFDFIEKEIVTTSLNLLRDFHDWEMALSWSPFGQFQSFRFDLHLKTGPLKEILKLQNPNSDRRDRFSQF